MTPLTQGLLVIFFTVVISIFIFIIEYITKEIRLFKYSVINNKVLFIIKNKYLLITNIRAVDTYLNQRCHEVSYFKARQNGNYTIAKGYLIDKENNEIIAHFVNYNTKNSQYLDYTLGASLERYDFYLVDNNVNVKTVQQVNVNLYDLQKYKQFNFKLLLKDYLKWLI